MSGKKRENAQNGVRENWVLNDGYIKIVVNLSFHWRDIWSSIFKSTKVKGIECNVSRLFKNSIEQSFECDVGTLNISQLWHQCIGPQPHKKV